MRLEKPGPETEVPLLPFLSLEGIKMVISTASAPGIHQPGQLEDGFRFMERPNARRVHLDLFYDYRTNVELYPAWQKFLRRRSQGR